MRRGGRGKAVDDGAGSSLGSTSREEVRGESSEAQCLAMLARSGLSMLAGKGVHMRPFTQPSSLGLRFVKREENGVVSVSSLPGGGSSGVAKTALRPPSSGDVVRRLSMNECWKMILELGTRWPTWKGPMALQATLGVKQEMDDSTFAPAGDNHPLQGRQSDTQQREQDLVKRLAARALKALAAQSPPWSVPRAGMHAPKQAQERLDRNLVAAGAFKPPRITTPPTLPVHQQPSSSAKAPTFSLDMSASQSTMARPQTAELTIFYDGTVIVCDNVTSDKARLIMMYAEKAGLSAPTGALPQRSRFAPSSSGASPQATRASDAGSPQRGHQPDSQSNKVPLPAGPSSSSTPCDLARSVSHVGISTSEPADENVDCANQGAHACQSPLPVKVTVTPQPANPPRQLRQNVTLKPLPNARRNSLARFLDSRKRSRCPGASSEETPPKKPALGEGSGPSDAAEPQVKLEPSNVRSPNVHPSKGGAASSDPC